MKKIVINTNQCLCCGSCVGNDNEHFDFNDAGFPEVISNENLDSNALNNAICSCPTEAISIVEEENATINEDAKCECGEECSCGSECNCDENCKCCNNCNCE